LEPYIFLEGQPDKSYQINFEEALFNRAEHRMLQSTEGWISFYILHSKNKTTEGAIHFNLNNNEAASPLRGSFGSVEFSDTLPQKELFDFFAFVEKRLRKKGAQRITIKNPPQLYNADQLSLVHVFLLNHAYVIATAEIGAVIRIDHRGYKDQFGSWEKKRRLRKSHESGLEFREIAIDSFKRVYDFILRNHQAKEYELSMTAEQLDRAVAVFKSDYKLFGVFNGSDLAAACISIRVNSQTLLNFYVEHDERYNHLSPVIMLIEGLFIYCVEHNISLLDLGTSAVDGKPNFGLLDFKLSLGAEATPKLTFQKDLK
jgi:hypothetical protein